MYYYIMESTGRKSAQYQERVKDILGDLGIAGETVSPSSARTVEELTNLGIVKGYSTIVAVGSEKLVNKVVTAIINHKGDNDVVLGVIPDNFSSSIAKMIGISELKEACAALKFRKLQEIDACKITPNKYFLTQAIIESSRSFDVYLSLNNIQAGLPCNKIIIKPGLEILVEDRSRPGAASQGIGGWFSRLFGKKEEEDIYSSYFQTTEVKIETSGQTIPIKADDEVIAKTPIICQARPKALKIISKRDSISLKE